MKGDFSRFTFDPNRHASDVLKQQGRVDLDADWNEQRAIDTHWRTTVLTDVVGRSGAPVDEAGLSVSASGSDLRLSAGRHYVDGILCENSAEVSLFDQPDLPAGMPVLQDASGMIGPVPPAPAPGVYTATLDVWPQHRTVVEDPDLREIALGGPDTTTRLRTVWQVRLLWAGAPGDDVTCADVPPGWAGATAETTGTLAAWADPTGGPASDCLIPLSAPYRGLENQLYRVEISGAGAAGSATYAWSRDNGSVVANWVGRNSDVLTVKSQGRDGSSGFSNGCWVQLTDDLTELRGEFGTLAQVDRVDGDQLVLKAGSATGSIDPGDFPVAPRVRRWDGIGTVPADGSDVSLELGVKVRFSSAAEGAYLSQSYWTFTARAATHDVDWPKTAGVADLLPAEGPRHSYARLAVVSFDGTNWTVERDCRELFAPLTNQNTLRYLSGDTQAVAPVVGSPAALVALPHPLVAAVTMGGRPVPDARVQFSVTAGAGHANGAAVPIVLTTDAEGIVACTWEVDSATAVQEIVAELLDSDDQPLAPSIRYSATLLTAEGVAYDPVDAASLAGSTTVKEALDHLAATTGSGCSTLTLAPSAGWVDALEALPAGEDAAVCFRPGLYESDRPVQLSGLGHIRFSGAGAASVIRVTKAETALQFTSCASVTVRDLTVEVQSYPKAPQSGRLGVVTVIDTVDVDLQRTRMACPADTQPRASCLTIRTNATPQAPGAAHSVRVADCDFVVGHGQTGVLVVNSHRTHVTGCTFTTPRKPASMSLAHLLTAPARRAKLVDRLVGDAVVDKGDELVETGVNTAFRVGTWAVGVPSTVPEAEWRKLVEAVPPTEADLAEPATVRRYLKRLTDEVVERPDRLPTFARSVAKLRERLGGRSNLVFGTDEGRETIKTLVVAGAFDVRPVAEVAIRRRTVEVAAGDSMVRFNSPLPQSTWSAILGALPSNAPADAGAMLRHIRASAERLLTDEVLGARLAGTFLKGLQAKNPSAAETAVVVAGVVVGEVLVRDNRIRHAAEGVHVAASHEPSSGTGALKARSVRIAGNEIALAVPVELEAAPRAIFVGNVERALVLDNRVDVPGAAALSGIEVFGVLGRHVMVRDNLVSGARTGVTIESRGEANTVALWAVVDNVLESARPLVRAPSAVRTSGNVG